MNSSFHFPPVPPGTAEFSVDWFSRHIESWKGIFQELRGKPGLRFLEIGTYEGRSASWLLSEVLTHPTSSLVCVDSFECVGEYDRRYGFDTRGVEDRCRANLRRFGEKVQLVKADAKRFLAQGSVAEESLDCVYIDGSHRSDDALLDGLLAWRALKVGGLMIFDDYLLQLDSDEFMHPKLGIDLFLTLYQGQYEGLRSGEQIVIRKTQSSTRLSR